MSIWWISVMFVAHYVADWYWQSDWMAINKSKWHTSGEGLNALTSHVALYSLVMALVMGLTKGNNAFYLWLLVTFVTHFVTDAITSQFTTKYFFFTPSKWNQSSRKDLWEADWGKRGPFFKWIGLDQLIHAITLLWTLNILG